MSDTALGWSASGWTLTQAGPSVRARPAMVRG